MSEDNSGHVQCPNCGYGVPLPDRREAEERINASSLGRANDVDVIARAEAIERDAQEKIGMVPDNIGFESGRLDAARDILAVAVAALCANDLPLHGVPPGESRTVTEPISGARVEDHYPSSVPPGEFDEVK